MAAGLFGTVGSLFQTLATIDATTDNSFITQTISTAGTTIPSFSQHQQAGIQQHFSQFVPPTDFSRGPSKLLIEEGRRMRICLPDGTEIDVQANGSFKINDKKAKVVYAANNVREFNRYINASDLLEEFIEHMGKCGVKQGEFLNLPIEIFINWLILRAAQRDGDPVPEGVVAPEDHPKAQQAKRFPRCRTCGRFVSRDKVADGLPWCDESHLLIFMRRREVKRITGPQPDGGRQIW